MGIGPARDVARGEDSRSAGLEPLRPPPGRGRARARPLRPGRGSAARRCPRRAGRRRAARRSRAPPIPPRPPRAFWPRWKTTPCSSCSPRISSPSSGPSDPLERPLVRRDHVDLHLSRAQRRRHLEPDEACCRARRRGRPRAWRPRSAGCRPASAGSAPPACRARARRSRRTGVAPVARSRASYGRSVPSLSRTRRPFGSIAPARGLAPELDPAVAVELGRMQRNPFLGRAAGQVVLGQVGPVVRGVRVRIHDGDRPAYPSRRSVSAAQLPAAPPPTITTRSGARDRRAGRAAAARFAADEDASAPLLHVPARQVVERRRPERLLRFGG